MSMSYVERRPTGFYLTGSRIPIDCVVQDYSQGEPPESIHQHYPALSLEQIHGAIAFYLGHQAEVDAVVAERRNSEETVGSAYPIPVELRDRLNRARQIIPRK